MLQPFQPSHPRRFLVLAGLLAALATPGAAQEPVLTVDGLLDEKLNETELSFDMAALAAMPVTQFTTETIWTEGPQTFTGVPLHEFREMAAEDAETFRATALNNYAITIPFSDAVEDGPIIAYALNGAPMSRRGKGPLWIVYPYDDNPAYKSETIYSRSIWQLERVTLE
ncbi:molybdopterin-dependent oxidoreductase [Profundibacterium mesophilum]|uniref:Oxidoreductase n=1 Tax=Profundibacterium mesophilum KAUST100406-0324 TaxID=1037889 RepID=A0A921TDY0_9RHOB|nr:molybdopterin-dependent oxidoreductase [Profundibacterium mesophilum]KAF0676786.1 uncharacterized protein PMES_00873 [Profundibacterium mesophilum KAUST100406-0324]